MEWLESDWVGIAFFFLLVLIELGLLEWLRKNTPL